MADVVNKSTNDQSVSPDEHVTFIHCCCERGSILSRPTEGKDMKIIDITKEDDFTKANTVRIVINR